MIQAEAPGPVVPETEATQAAAPPGEAQVATAEDDPFAALTRYQEERKKARTRKKKGESP